MGAVHGAKPVSLVTLTLCPSLSRLCSGVAFKNSLVARYARPFPRPPHTSFPLLLVSLATGSVGGALALLSA